MGTLLKKAIVELFSSRSENSLKPVLMKDGKEPPDICAPCKKSVHMDVFIPHNTLAVQKASNYKGQFVALQPRSVLLSILNLPKVNLFFHSFFHLNMCFPALEFTILPSAFKEYSAILP